MEDEAGLAVAGRLRGLLYPTLVPGRQADPGRDKSHTIAPLNFMQRKHNSIDLYHFAFRRTLDPESKYITNK